MKHRQNAAHAANFPVKRQFTEDKHSVKRLALQLIGCGKDRQRNRKIVGRAFFSCVRGRKIDRDMRKREGKPAVFERRAHSFARFLYRRVRQADRVVGGKNAAGDIHLHVDLEAVKSV